MARVVDYAPLTTPPSRADVDAWRAAARASSAPWAALGVGQVVTLAIGGFLVAMFAFPLIAGVLVTIASGFDAVGAILTILFSLGLLTVFGILIVRAAIRGGGKWERWVRIDRFARANGFRFSPADPNPSYPGAIFQQGSSRTALDHLTTVEGRFLDLGNYRYVTGSGKSRTVHDWGFLALELDRRVPHMVLDSRANNGLFGGTNLPAVFDRDQVLELEGDFGAYFTLYCPAEYERDALYVFTPDLMALLIDHAAPFDVEVIDDWMFVFSRTPFDMTAPATYQRLFRIVDTVGAKAVTQTDRYADERVGARTQNIVAPQGARLKRGVSVGAILAVAVVAAFWIFGIVGDIAETFTP
jgi:hypothetical protein